jgi:hypothetical protein
MKAHQLNRRQRPFGCWVGLESAQRIRTLRAGAREDENATFRAKVIAKAQRLALAAIRAGR